MKSVDLQLFDIFLNSIPLHLVILLSGSLFFFTIAIRDLKSGVMQGVLSLAFAFFLGAGHLTYLLNLPEESGYGISTVNLLNWTVNYLAPTMMILLTGRGLWNLIVATNPNGLVRLFWGVTLAGYLHFIGEMWPLDLKVSITAFYFVIYLIMETDPADEPMLTVWRTRG